MRNESRFRGAGRPADPGAGAAARWTTAELGRAKVRRAGAPQGRPRPANFRRCQPARGGDQKWYDLISLSYTIDDKLQKARRRPRLPVLGAAAHSLNKNQ